MKTSIDVNRCMKAMMYVWVEGDPRGASRQEVIADAIAQIQANGQTALTTQYLGVKNYAAFGDQRCDCTYGMGPKHGGIVFRVGRVSREKEDVLGADEIYLLECVRDFGTFANEHDKNHYNSPKEYNLCDLLRKRDRLKDEIETYDAALSSAHVEAHVA